MYSMFVGNVGLTEHVTSLNISVANWPETSFWTTMHTHIISPLQHRLFSKDCYIIHTVVYIIAGITKHSETNHPHTAMYANNPVVTASVTPSLALAQQSIQQ